jgi:NAD-dependent deacetylase
MAETLQRVRAGEDDPHCLVCAENGRVGVLKSDTVSFGQQLVPEVIDAAMRAADDCDLLLAAGSMLSVFPAANVVPRARASGALVVIVNGEPTAMDRFADVVLIGSLGELLPSLISP